MTTPADNQNPEDTDEPIAGFAIRTPFGIFTDLDDLPPELRDALVQSLDAEGLPPEVRAMLVKALGVDGAQNTVTADETRDAAHGAHAPGCTCAEIHRDQVWAILDTAFPDNPHLWRAGEALFTLSAANPRQPDDHSRRAELETATLLLQRHAALMTPPPSSTEQLVSKFREQMGEL